MSHKTAIDFLDVSMNKRKRILGLRTIGGAGYITYDEELYIKWLSILQREIEVCRMLQIDGTINSDVVMLESFNSATIEGAKTTIAEVKSAITKNEKTKSELMVLNLLKANEIELGSKVTLDTLLDMWFTIVDGCCENTNAGTDGLRSGMVYVGSESKVVHVPEKPMYLEQRMKELLLFVNSTEDKLLASIVSHFYLEYIHPFCDGNGRLGRLFAMKVLNKDEAYISLPIARVINESLGTYYRVFCESEKPCGYDVDITPFMEYMLNVYQKALKQYQLLSKPLCNSESLIMQKITEQNRGTISVAKAAKILDCTEWEAVKVLNALVDKGYLVFRNNEYRLSWRTLN